MKRILPNKIFTTLLILFLLQSVNLSQTRDLRFEYLSMKDGLPDDGLNCVIQDHLGFLWIGTANGLSKYDGYTFTNYNLLKEGYNNANINFIWLIMEDTQGDIWAGTSNGGLAIFLRNEERFVFYFHEENNPNSISHNWVSAILEDSKGNMWIGTKGGGLNFLNKKFLTNKNSDLIFQHIEINDTIEGTDFIYDIHEDFESNIWVCTMNGLFHISNALSRLIQPIKSNSLNKKNHFNCIEQDASGIFWIGTSRYGIVKYDKVLSEFEYFPYNEEINKPFSPNNITSLLIDSKNNLWAGTRGGSNSGLLLFNRKTKQFLRYINDPINPNSISEDGGVVRSIIKDNVGNIWIAQNEGKLNKINPQKNLYKYHWKYSRDKNQLRFSRQTRMFVARNGKIWFASENGLFQYISDTDKFIKIEAINQNYECTLNSKCWGITEDKDGNIWTVGGQSKSKLIKYNPETEEIDCLEQKNKLGVQNVYCILEDNNGIMWLGTLGGGLKKWNPKTNKVINFNYNPNDSSSISSDNILRICEDSSNSIWIALNNAGVILINKINKQTNQVERIPLPVGTNYVCNLFVDSKNRLWAGSKSGGVFLFNTFNNSYKRITTEQGLPTNNYATGFSEDHNGNIFCCTTSYLVKLNKDAEVERYYRIAIDDEILHTTFYIKKTKEVFVVSDKGFYRFFPDSLKPNLITPKMVLTEMTISDEILGVEEDSPLNKHINVAENIVLQHWQNDISIQYAAIHYINPSENKYKYILENYDNHWREAGKNRMATYTNLSHGDYKFKVLGSNSDGVWATEPASISITIFPPWWLTWWAYLIYVIIFIGVLSYLYYLQRKRLKVIHRLEMKEFETVKLKEVNQMKSKFFANISHEFRTPLTLIKGPIERLLDNNNVDDPKKIYRMIKRNSERLLNLINELLDLSKLESGKMKLSAQKSDIVSFIRALVMSFESLAERKSIRITAISSSKLIELYFDKEKMQKIITNLLSNAFKFTDEGGEVSVNLEAIISDQNAYIKITDTGIGIPEEELPKIFDRFYQTDNSSSEGTGIGLSLTKELVEIHHGTVDVESVVEKGTTFTLTFPLGREHLNDEELIYNESEQFIKEDLDDEAIDSTIKEEEGKPLILVVEDNKDVREFIAGIFKDDYRLLEAGDGEEGYQISLDQMPDLIVSDIMMPKLTGDKMCEMLKNNQITSHIPIILLTAKSSGEDKIEGLEIGADDYLIKPFDEKELLARINNLLDQRKNLREKYLREAEIHPTEVAVTSVDKVFIENVINIIDKNISIPEFNVDKMASELAVSRMQLYRKFMSVLGQKPNEFIRKYRIKRAAELIKNNYGNITQVAYEVGFNDISHFAKCFKREFNMNPNEFEKIHCNSKPL